MCWPSAAGVRSVQRSALCTERFALRCCKGDTAARLPDGVRTSSDHVRASSLSCVTRSV